MSDLLRPHDRALERLSQLHPKKIDLSLDRMARLCAALGHPERRLPPVVHVAGTNGKGSTVAFLRAIAEAAGLKVHVFTSPHLVRFAERIRLAGRLIEDDALAALLDRVEQANAGLPITFFEITAAAALLAFAETPADLLLLEVGLGGRWDATNVVEGVAVSVIAPVDHDHREFLGDSLAGIAAEKAGVLRPGVPAVVAHQQAEALEAIEAEAERVGAPLRLAGRDWDAWAERGRLMFQAGGLLHDLPPPGIPGAHQFANAGLAIAAAMALQHPAIDEAAVAAGIAGAHWPARLQRLTAGPLAEMAAATRTDLWLDGAHNPHGAAALADFVRSLAARDGRPVTLVIGLLANKDAKGMFGALAGTGARVTATGFDAPTAARPEDLAAAAREAGLVAEAAPDVTAAVRKALTAERPPHVIIAGSLYLAGEVLAMSEETWPT
jgi:dihydrofolate synthase/folylpolyglutamate synthase